MKCPNLNEGDYEFMYTMGPPPTIAVVRCYSEKTRLIGSGSGSSESEIFIRKICSNKEKRLGKEARLVPQIAVDYNNLMGGVDTADNLHNRRFVACRSK